jgi:tripartite-type tricarboxylate transporter receptor subunit TctC
MARAQTYPTRPVHVIVGFPAGTSADTFARLMGQWLSSRLGHPFITDNRPGAGSNIATEAVARAVPDGHTLLWTTAANATSATFYRSANFNFVRDIMPVAGVIRTFYVLVVNPSVPAKTFPEFVAYAKANPGKINMAAGGSGTQLHLAGELLKMMTGIDTVHVPYHGDEPALIDLVAGRVQVMIAGSAAIEQVKAGNLRPLGVTTLTRLDVLPDVPPISDFVPGYEASGWQGLGTSRSTPVEIVEALNKAVNAGLADPELKARYAALGSAVLPGSPADFGRLMAEETEKWAKVIRAANIKPE